MIISIIIPCYNVEKNISQLLDSILCQINGNSVEIICVNDGSSDSTLDVLTNIASNNSSLNVINQENGGPASARNSGLDKAVGDYIWFVDGDDQIDSYAIDTLIQEIYSNPTDVICFNYNRVDVNGNIVPNYKHHIICDCHHTFKGTEAYAKYKIPAYLWNRVIKRELIEKHHIRFGIIPEDEDFLINTYLVANSFRFINSCLYYYKEIESSFSKSLDSHCKYYEGYFLIMDKYSSLIDLERNDAFWQLFIWSCIRNIFINYNRIKVRSIHNIIDDRKTMYKKIRNHLVVYESSISRLSLRSFIIKTVKNYPFLLDFPCYFIYKIKDRLI